MFKYTVSLVIVLTLFVSGCGGDETATGTYERDGSTLTLNDDDGEVIIFKKK